jgi:hypothetical protein
MQEFELAAASAARVSQQVRLLMRAVKWEVSSVEARLGSFMRRGEVRQAGALRGLLGDVARHYVRATSLGGQALTLAAAGCEQALPMLERLVLQAAAEPLALGRLTEQVRRDLELFDTTRRTVLAVTHRAERDLDTLRETTLRCDLPPQVANATCDLMQRLRQQR